MAEIGTFHLLLHVYYYCYMFTIIATCLLLLLHDLYYCYMFTNIVDGESDTHSVYKYLMAGTHITHTHLSQQILGYTEESRPHWLLSLRHVMS